MPRKVPSRARSYRVRPVELKAKITLSRGGFVTLGPGKIELLERIERMGSIAAAARGMRMSYRQAWLLIRRLNATAKEPLVSASVGGAGGGGATVTSMGRDVLKEYRALQKEIETVLRRRRASLRKILH